MRFLWLYNFYMLLTHRAGKTNAGLSIPYLVNNTNLSILLLLFIILVNALSLTRDSWFPRINNHVATQKRSRNRANTLIIKPTLCDISHKCQYEEKETSVIITTRLIPLKQQYVCSVKLTSIMCRSDSSSLIARETIRFLGETDFSPVSECILKTQLTKTTN